MYFRRRFAVRMGVLLFLSAERESDAEHTGTKDDLEQRSKTYREARKRRKHSEEAEKDDGAGAGHAGSISGRNDDHKFAAHCVRMSSIVCRKFGGCPPY